MTWGVNLGVANVTNAVNMATLARSIVKAFGTAAVTHARVTLDMDDMVELGAVFDYPVMPRATLTLH